MLRTLNTAATEVLLCRAVEAEVEERWSFVGRKGERRWRWQAWDHRPGTGLAYVFGKRQDQAFLELKARLQPFGIRRYDTDGWGTYQRHIEPEVQEVGKHHTQQLERKHLTLRTRIK